MTHESDPKRALAGLAKLAIPLAIISLAEHGLLFSFEGECFSIPAFSVDVADPVGAGDAFNAGIIRLISEWGPNTLHRSISGEKLFDLLVYASAAGAAAVTGIGSLAGVNEKTVSRLLADQGNMVKSSITKI